MQRTFILGDKWLYYKLYCGKRVADTLLIEVIKPLTEKLLVNKLIDQWFFIRYSDPKPHIRIRFHCNEVDNLGVIIDEIVKSLKYYVENDLIWKVQVDTYQREIERYGEENMLMSEKLFFIESETCVNALNLIEDDELLFLFTLKSMDSILNLFGFNLNDKRNFVMENAQAFKYEFKSDKVLGKQLYKKHQNLSNKIEVFMGLETDIMYQPLLNLLKQKTNDMKRLIGSIIKNSTKQETSLESLLSSYIHMMVNRLFRDQQRLHELVCYDCLYRFYNFKFATRNE